MQLLHLHMLLRRYFDFWTGDNEEVCPHILTNGSHTASGKWEPGIPVPENPLLELTETAHMILFMVMMLYLLESFVLIERAMSHIREWKEFEDFCVSILEANEERASRIWKAL